MKLLSSSGWQPALAILVSWVGITTAQNYPQTTDENCDCFMVESTHSNNPFYYKNHNFLDFRQRSSDTSNTPPNLIDDPDDSEQAEYTATYFSQVGEFGNDWQISAWNNQNGHSDDTSGAVKLMVMSRNNVYFERDQESDDTYLVLRTARHDGFQSAGEITTKLDEYRYLSVRMEARTLGDPGACTAMFTYGQDGTQETDVEFLTREDDTIVHFTNQPAYTEDGEIPGASKKMDMPRPYSYNNWHTYRMDWTETYTSWYIDDELIYNMTFQVPKDGLQLMFNSWGNGGEWTGEMEDGDEAFLQIRYIEWITNTTGTTGGDGGFGNPDGSCHTVCSIDKTTTLGTPVLLNEGSQPAGDGEVQGGETQGCAAAQYEQCGGSDHNGCFRCTEPLQCVMKDQWYSQCLEAGSRVNSEDRWWLDWWIGI